MRRTCVGTMHKHRCRELLTKEIKTMNKTVEINLDYPITLGEQKVSKVILRKPSAGDLRGIRMVQIGQLNYDEFELLLPRITEPTLNKVHLQQLDPADLLFMMDSCADFFQRKSQAV